MAVQIGMPIQYCNSNLLICPGLVLDLSGGAIGHIQYFDESIGKWQTSVGEPPRDDTQKTADSWTVVTFQGTTTIESGD